MADDLKHRFLTCDSCNNAKIFTLDSAATEGGPCPFVLECNGSLRTKIKKDQIVYIRVEGDQAIIDTGKARCAYCPYTVNGKEHDPLKDEVQKRIHDEAHRAEKARR